MVEPRLTFGWTLSPAVLGAPAAAVVFSHRHTTFEAMRPLDECRRMMSHLRIDPKIEIRKPTSITPDVRISFSESGRRGNPFCKVLDLDNIASLHAQLNDGDESSLQISST